MSGWRSGRVPWRSQLKLWLPPLVLVLVSAAVLSTYRFAYAGRVVRLVAQLDEEREDLARLQAQRADVEALVSRIERSRDGIKTLYEESFSSERVRLTDLIREIKELATQAQLLPRAINYPEEELKDFDLIKRSVVFPVEGSYEQLRKFVNFLELTPSYVVLEGIQVVEGDPDLRINLVISTLFAGRDRIGPSS